MTYDVTCCDVLINISDPIRSDNDNDNNAMRYDTIRSDTIRLQYDNNTI